jgi:hypothetical protein
MSIYANSPGVHTERTREMTFQTLPNLTPAKQRAEIAGGWGWLEHFKQEANYNGTDPISTFVVTFFKTRKLQ